jgi:hypothetical protein
MGGIVDPIKDNPGGIVTPVQKLYPDNIINAVSNEPGTPALSADSRATDGIAASFTGNVTVSEGTLTVSGTAYVEGTLFLPYAKGLAMMVGGDASLAGTLTVGKDLVLTGADCAEEFDLQGVSEADPGTVMVLDEMGRLEPSRRVYDKKVAGVVSGAGDHRPGMILDRRDTPNKRAALALMGKVFCKVDAQYAPVEVGDLLTTSLTPGHAMKATDAAKAFGSVIGKALRPLVAGQGLIPVLVSLQ